MSYNVGDSRVGKSRVVITTPNGGNLCQGLLPTRPPNTFIGESGRGEIYIDTYYPLTRGNLKANLLPCSTPKPPSKKIRRCIV